MHRSSVLPCLLPILLPAWGALGAAVAAPEDVAALLDGVREITAPGIPGALCPFGDDAFAVAAGRAGGGRLAVVAAARLGQGRVVALGHNGYFGGGGLREADTPRFMVNAVRWLARGEEPRVAVLGLEDFGALMAEQGLSAEALQGAEWPEQLRRFNVLVTTATPGFTPAQVAAVSAFIRNGGGLLSGDTPWGWLQLNPGKTLSANHGGNAVVAPAGLLWVDGMLDRTSERGFATEAPLPELLHAGRALDAIEAQAGGTRQLSQEEIAQASLVITTTALSLPAGDTLLLPRLERVQQEHAAAAVPGPDQPLGAEKPLERLAVTLGIQKLRSAPAEEVTPHPSGELFPGAVPADAPRVTRTTLVDTAVPAWHSTGLYAAPGERIEVRLPAEAAGKGLSVQIGCHTDGIWHLDTWRRCPEIVRRYALAEPVTPAANAFGGLVYIDVPGGSQLGTVAVEIAGAIEAPHFVMGRTDPAEWRREVRGRPAPWAEMETPSIVLTVPSSEVRDLDDPVPLMELWSHVLDSCAELAAQPEQRERPERIVADVQIGGGYMHSGYPIMTHLDAALPAMSLEQLVTSGSWGHFHELGHNHQSGDWTFEGTGEVTENLFSLYILDRCCHLSGPGHPAIKPEDRAKRTADYLAAGAPFEKWQGDPFLALYMYMQLQEAFGWQAFRQVFAEYRDLPGDQRPQSDDDKRDQWLVRLSRTVGRNLGPFFQAWGVPTSEGAQARIADLPVWMPEGFPPAGP